MDVDMARVGGEHRLIGAQEGVDGQKVGLGAAHHKVDVRLRGGAEGADGIRRRRAVAVQAVAAGLL